MTCSTCKNKKSIILREVMQAENKALYELCLCEECLVKAFKNCVGHIEGSNLNVFLFKFGVPANQQIAA